MSENKGFLSAGLSMVLRNKRYVAWFYILNLLLGLFGTFSFANQAGAVLDRSLLSERLVHGFSAGVLIEMFARPEFGPTIASRGPAMFFAILFLFATALFLPGVFQGYASTYRLPREDFFRACGRNLWRYIRLLIVAGIVMGFAAGILFGIQGWLATKVGKSTNELLAPQVQFGGLGVIFLVMTFFRIWFDLAEADIVLNDQRAVRKSIAVALRHTLQSVFRLMASYVIASVVATVILLGGIYAWMKFIAPENVMSAFMIAQLTLLLLLIPRFWQRGVAVAYWKQRMMAPVLTADQMTANTIMPSRIEPTSVPASAGTEAAHPIPDPPSEPQGF
jgi:hypothetical protein